MKENSYYDRKSLSIIMGKKAQWKELAKDCVCFSNSVGGYIDIGIEDNEDLPFKDQRIEEDLVGLIQKKISSLTHNSNCYSHQNEGREWWRIFTNSSLEKSTKYCQHYYW